MYRIDITARAKKELDRLHLKEFKNIDAAIRALAKEPRPQGVKKLKGPICRIRVGDWRVIYAVFDKDQLIIVGKVARRSKRTYEKVDKLF